MVSRFVQLGGGCEAASRKIYPLLGCIVSVMQKNCTRRAREGALFSSPDICVIPSHCPVHDPLSPRLCTATRFCSQLWRTCCPFSHPCPRSRPCACRSMCTPPLCLLRVPCLETHCVYTGRVWFVVGVRDACSIIYAHKRETTTELARDLTARGFPAVAYHAGLKVQRRSHRAVTPPPPHTHTHRLISPPPRIHPHPPLS
jgi:hypothetical protein